MKDNEILELYFLRDERAIAETKAKYGKYCQSIAKNILSDNCDAEECENDTYNAAWNSIPPQRPENLSAYLGKITRNIALKALRSKNAEKRKGSEAILSLDELEDCISCDKSISDELDNEELARIISDFLRSLKKTERQIFVCRYWYCDSIADICFRFGLGESKVKMMLLRTRNKLAKHLTEKGVYL